MALFLHRSFRKDKGAQIRSKASKAKVTMPRSGGLGVVTEITI